MEKLWEDDFDAEVSIDSMRQKVNFLCKKFPDGIVSSVRGIGFKLN